MTRRSRIEAALGLCCLLAAKVTTADARADPPPAERVRDQVGARTDPPGRMRLELRAGLGVRRDALTSAGARSEVEGRALSDLVIGGAWFARGSAFGLAGRLELDRFSLSGGGGPRGSSGSALRRAAAAGGAGAPGAGPPPPGGAGGRAPR